MTLSLHPIGVPIPKPTKKTKAAPKGLPKGGRKPKEAGRRFEQRMVEKYNNPPAVKVKRQVGSGAFGKADPTLLGDLLIDIGRLRMVAEAKSWATVNAQGEKTITVPASVLYKLDQEAKLLNRDPIGLFHLKNDTEEWVFVRASWFIEKLAEWEATITALSAQLEEALAA